MITWRSPLTPNRQTRLKTLPSRKLCMRVVTTFEISVTMKRTVHSALRPIAHVIRISQQVCDGKRDIGKGNDNICSSCNYFKNQNIHALFYSEKIYGHACNVHTFCLLINQLVTAWKSSALLLWRHSDHVRNSRTQEGVPWAVGCVGLSRCVAKYLSIPTSYQRLLSHLNYNYYFARII